MQPKPNLQEKLAHIARLVFRGDLRLAEPAARQLLAAYPRRSEAQHALGRVLLLGGRPELAEDHLRRAVDTDKGNALCRLDLGQCLLVMGRVVEAEAQFERARALAPSSAVVNWRFGTWLLAIGRGEEALSAFDRALASASGEDRPRIHLDKVECLLSMGRTEEAEREIRAEFMASPFRSRYIVLLSQVNQSAEVLALLDTELARPGLHVLARSDLMLRRGSLRAKGGQHAEAFKDWIAAKQLLRAAPRGAELGRIVDERIAAFPAETIARLSALYGTPGPKPIFVIGLPRSGTTLVSEILAAHEEVGNAGEIETMTYAAAMMLGAHPVREMAQSLAEQGPEKARALAKLYWDTATHLASPKPRPVDKMPNNFLYLGEIAILFPEARFIDCVRHPADTFISAIQTEMNEAHAYTHDPEDFALYHRHHRRMMQHWHEALPGRILELSYEKLVSEPRSVVGELLAFLDLPWQEACLSPGANQSTVRTFSRLQVRSAIHAGSVGRWKPYAEWLGPLASG
jgi:Flp pilus assembly protein TadD